MPSSRHVIDSATAAYESAGIKQDQVDAFWLGTSGSGISGLTLSKPLQLDYKPVTRVENMCATGSEAFRNACYAVASGAYDMVMAIGVEKLKDSGYSGLTGNRPPDDGTSPATTAPANFSLLAPAYAHKHGVGDEQMKEVLYQASPMSPAHRGSVKELSFHDPTIEPLHEMEELFDLLESIRKADLNAPCFDTDAHTLKELMGKEYTRSHAAADSRGEPERGRTDEFVAHTTALRKASTSSSSHVSRHTQGGTPLRPNNSVLGVPVYRRGGMRCR